LGDDHEHSTISHSLKNGCKMFLQTVATCVTNYTVLQTRGQKSSRWKRDFPHTWTILTKLSELHKKVLQKAFGVNLHISLLHIIFSYMFQFIWAVIKENQVLEKICIKTLTCILARMRISCWYKIQQQVLCIQYKWRLKLEGLK
jgi:hypothetical protein